MHINIAKSLSSTGIPFDRCIYLPHRGWDAHWFPWVSWWVWHPSSQTCLEYLGYTSFGLGRCRPWVASLGTQGSRSAYSHIITSELKKKLEVNKYYEFTYTLKGTTNNKINNIDDVLSYFSFNNAIRSDNRLKVLLEVKETDKLGMEQIQEDICKNK